MNKKDNQRETLPLTIVAANNGYTVYLGNEHDRERVRYVAKTPQEVLDIINAELQTVSV